MSLKGHIEVALLTPTLLNSFLKILPIYLSVITVLSQGVVVLSRQWKNALYMPLLMEQTFRNKQARPTFNYRSVYNFFAV